MKTTAKLITVVAIAGLAGACSPAPVEDEVRAGGCQGKCDDTGDGAAQLRYGERLEVGPVGEFGIQADWTEVVEISVEPDSRARLAVEPLEGGGMPELSIYRDLGTSVEWVAESDDGLWEVEGTQQTERYVIEIYGPPSATGGAIVELQCAAGDCEPAAPADDA